MLAKLWLIVISYMLYSSFLVSMETLFDDYLLNELLLTNTCIQNRHKQAQFKKNFKNSIKKQALEKLYQESTAQLYLVLLYSLYIQNNVTCKTLRPWFDNQEILSYLHYFTQAIERISYNIFNEEDLSLWLSIHLIMYYFLEDTFPLPILHDKQRLEQESALITYLTLQYEKNSVCYLPSFISPIKVLHLLCSINKRYLEQSYWFLSLINTMKVPQKSSRHLSFLIYKRPLSSFIITDIRKIQVITHSFIQENRVTTQTAPTHSQFQVLYDTLFEKMYSQHISTCLIM